MTRPKLWYQLPAPLCERMATNANLEYDHYESSHADALDKLLNDPTYSTDNNEIVQKLYEGVTDEQLKTMAAEEVQAMRYKINAINNMLYL